MTSEAINLKAIDDLMYTGAAGCIEDMHADQPPLILTWVDGDCSIYDVHHLMPKRELVGRLVGRLVGTPGVDYVAQIAQGYALSIEENSPESMAKWRLHRAGVSLKDIPGHIEVVTVTIYDKTQPQCTAWSVQHEVRGHKLIRGELHELNECIGRMTAPIPRRQDAQDH